jgi:hypothetical protein
VAKIEKNFHHVFVVKDIKILYVKNVSRDIIKK